MGLNSNIKAAKRNSFDRQIYLSLIVIAFFCFIYVLMGQSSQSPGIITTSNQPSKIKVVPASSASTSALLPIQINDSLPQMLSTLNTASPQQASNEASPNESNPQLPLQAGSTITDPTNLDNLNITVPKLPLPMAHLNH